jgi:hemoglobin
MAEASLCERLGGVFSIAAVVDRFGDALVPSPIIGQKSDNPALRKRHTDSLARLPGLTCQRTLWVCHVAGGPHQFAATEPGSTDVGLAEAHREFRVHQASPTTSLPNSDARWNSSASPGGSEKKSWARSRRTSNEVTQGYAKSRP